MGNGIIVYPTIAILALMLVAGAALTAYLSRAPQAVILPLLVACAGTVTHFLCTAKAAPNMLNSGMRRTMRHFWQANSTSLPSGTHIVPRFNS